MNINSTCDLVCIDLQHEQSKIDFGDGYWTIGHDLLSPSSRQALIEAHRSKKPVTVSVLFWPGDGTEFKCTGIVTAIAPAILLKGEMEIPPVPRERLVSAD